jgi:hypothetical protein
MTWRTRPGTRGGGLGFGSWLPMAGAARGRRRAVVGLLWRFTDYNTQRKRLRGRMCCSLRRELAGDVAEGDRRRRRAAGTVGPSWEDQRRGTPGCWAPWIASRVACGGVQGVRTARTPPAARELPWWSSSLTAESWLDSDDAGV